MKETLEIMRRYSEGEIEIDDAFPDGISSQKSITLHFPDGEVITALYANSGEVLKLVFDNQLNATDEELEQMYDFFEGFLEDNDIF